MFEINFNELKEKGFYKYVCDHSNDMEKDQLANMIKELTYSILNFGKVYVGINKEDSYTILGNAYDILNEQYNNIEMPSDETLITG